MSIKYIYFDKAGFDDIACDDTDVIVSAANGCGWMGGRQARISLCKGVAEHLSFLMDSRSESRGSIQNTCYRCYKG